MPFAKRWQRDLVANQTPAEREADEEFYRKARQQMASFEQRQAMEESSRAFYVALDDAGRLHETIRQRVAAAVAEGRETGMVRCPCGGIVYYSSVNRFGYRPARCTDDGCMNGAVRPLEVTP